MGAHLCMLRMHLSSGTFGYHTNLLKSSTPCGTSSRRSLSSHRHLGRPVDETQVLSKWPLSLGQWRLLFSLALFLGWGGILSSSSVPGLSDKTRSLALGGLSQGLSLHMKSALLGELEASLSDDRSPCPGGTGSSLTCWKGFGHSLLTRCEGGLSLRSLLQMVEAVTPVHRL